jgi:hypothetical protein
MLAYGGRTEAIQDPVNPDEPTDTLGWRTFAGAAYVVSEPIGASTYFPANDEPDDKATFDITVTVPKPLVAVANGRLRKVRDLGAARSFAFEMKQPMSTWLATVHVNDFDVTHLASRGQVPITIYTTPATAEDVTVLARARDMLLLRAAVGVLSLQHLRQCDRGRSEDHLRAGVPVDFHVLHPSLGGLRGCRRT